MRFITILCMIFFLLICLLAAIVKGQLMCGREVRNETCADNKCCSQHGYCGITEEYCSISYNCQSNCKIGRNNTSTKDPPMCGREVRNETCADNKCCSQHGFCGTTEDYCLTSYNCQSNCKIGRNNTTAKEPLMCGRDVSNVTCEDNMCCSQYGFCGTTEDYCSTSKNCQSNCKFGGSDEDPIFQSCGDDVSANYTSGSQFESNLINLLLPSLVSNGSVSGFFNTSTSFGKGTDTIYGLAQCRGDISMEVCKTCLNASTTDIIRVCPNKKDALVHPGKCLLRYSNIRFFSQLESLEDKDTYSFIWPSNTKLTKRVVFSKQLESLMKRLMENASSNPSRFMTGSISTKFDDLSKIYGLVQCTEDLSSSDCLTCLGVMFDRIKIERKGAWVLTSSCQIRYRDFMFFSPASSPSASSPPASSPPALSPPSDAKRGDNNGSSSSSSLKIAAIAIPTSVGGGVLLLVFVCIFFIKWKTNRKSNTAGSGNIIGDAEPLQFDLVTIKIATENFSDANKLGEGGFGVVYKGELLDGQEIAVKRLSNKAGQGSQEFKNEVVLLHNLQHRNLVKLLGYCYLEAEEAILIYEYVPNRSLDNFLFDPSEKRHLDWQTRYKIIGGVARGLLYLHEDSRLKIIHRDLKAGNILLDAEMNAKIADFGLAKLVGVDQTQVNASRIAGTFGYMAPEYALHGIFSVKSDVFSFGVLLLEIVSGQKISKFHDQLNQPQDLLSYAWKHWRKGTTLEMMDSTLVDKFSRDEVMRCIHIALLCVQDNIEERPTMSSVVLMLSSYSLTLQSPSEPAFCYSKTISVMFQGVQTQTSSLLNTKPS